MQGIYIFLADGFEDMEALGTLDVLRRGGLEVQTVSINPTPQVLSSRGVKVEADLTLDSIVDRRDGKPSDYDVMIFPGGMPGSRNLSENDTLMDMMKRHYDNGGLVAAICAAPGLVASKLNLPEGTRFTCFDGYEERLLDKGCIYLKESTVDDNRLITGRGAGHAVNFGLTILRHIKGIDAVAKVKAGLML